jgi:hypothetical protein
VRGACASGGFGRYARGCFAAARFLHSSSHDALGGCSLFTFFYILHDALGGCSLFFYILLLVCLGGVKVFVICAFIGKLTAFLQLQEFIFLRHTQVVSSPSAARLSSLSYRAK